jgi:hypothetical protein
MTTLTLSAWRSLVRRDADYLAQTEAGSFAIVPGTQLSEAEAEAEKAEEADRQYLERQDERMRRRQQETQELERGYFSRMGWRL